MYSSSRSSFSRSSDRSSSDRKPYDRSWSVDRKPYTGRGDSAPRTGWYGRDGGSDRPTRTFDRKPYAGKPIASRGGARPSSDRGMDPRQMRYQVIGRTTDESDLIVQISPAFYEYIRSMAHQWVPAPRVEEDKPRYSKFDHPYHKDPLHTSYDRSERKKPHEKPAKKSVESWDDDDIDVDAIDAEMDDEYEMIKQWFAKLKQNDKKPWVKKTTPKTNKKKI